MKKSLKSDQLVGGDVVERKVRANGFMGPKTT